MKPWEFQFRISGGDDQKIRWIWASGNLFKYGNTNHMIGIVQDITQRKDIEDSKVILSALVESSDEAIMSNDLSGIITTWNKAAETLYGYTKKEMLGMNVITLYPLDKQTEFYDTINQILHGEPIKHKESVRVHKEKYYLPLSITISPIKNIEGIIIGASTTARDITQQKLMEEKLKHLAEHDTLTGLITRPLFEDRLIQAIALAKRAHNTIAVCFIDLDDFKKINDNNGHAMGDFLLSAAAKRMEKCIRESDTLARLGGDEFGLILSGIKAVTDVSKVLRKLITKLSKEFMIDHKPLAITISIGVAMYPEHGHNLLIEKADAAMYYVKNHGKGDYKIFDDSLQLL